MVEQKFVIRCLFPSTECEYASIDGFMTNYVNQMMMFDYAYWAYQIVNKWNREKGHKEYVVESIFVQN